MNENAKKSIEVYAPASMGNVAVGFDCLGAALKRIDGRRFGDTLTIEASSRNQFNVTGEFAKQLPEDHSDNVILAGLDLFHARLPSEEIHSLNIQLQKNLPVGSGLGSSSSSICVAIAGFNKFYGAPFSDIDLLHMMAELEGSLSGSIHYDNVAPCFLGGLQLITGVTKQPVQQIPVFDSWYWVAAYPGTQLNTQASRAVLPKQVDLKLSVRFAQQLATFISASEQGNARLAAEVFSDLLVEPYRQHLIPHLSDFKRCAKEYGAITSSISGAGPTTFAVFEDLQTAKNFEGWCLGYFQQTPEAFVHVCQIDKNGVIITENEVG